jgi:hypothetical protein
MRELAGRKGVKRQFRKIRLTQLEEPLTLGCAQEDNGKGGRKCEQTTSVATVEQCCSCKCFCYLSWVESDCVSGKVSCSEHADQVSLLLSLSVVILVKYNNNSYMNNADGPVYGWFVAFQTPN